MHFIFRKVLRLSMRGLEALVSPAELSLSCSVSSTCRRRRRARRDVRCLWNLFRDSTPPRKTSYHDVELPPLFSTVVEDTFLADKELSCCYKASVDGFSAYDFHSCCDFQGPCFVVGLSEAGLRFGGFNPLGFRGTDDYYETFKAFLFYWPGDVKSPPVILPKVGGSGAAIFDYARGGPQFGADGLLIGPPLVPVMGGFSGPDGKESIFGDERKVKLVEVEAFASPAIAQMY